MIRRIVGVLFIIIAIAGWVIAYQGTKVTNQFIDNLAMSMDNALQITTDTLTNVQSTLGVAKQTLTDLGTTLTTMETTASDMAASIDDAQPLIDEVNTVVTQDVPTSIESVQNALPSLVEVATVIDDTLRTLSRFQLNIPRIINFDLGVDYDPEVPFDEAVVELGGSLDGLPERLRGLETQLATSQSSLDVMGQNMDQLATDMATLNTTIAEVQPVLDEYIRITTDTNDRLRLVRQQIDNQAAQVKEIFRIIFIWMALFQLVPLYLGLEMVAGERGIEQYVTEEEFAERMARYEQLLAAGPDTAVSPPPDATAETPA
jgi:ABC-type transporter Mla subunit MlaD